MRHLPLEWRFWPKVLPVDTGCWEWQGTRQDGYGVIRSRGLISSSKAHRVAYAMMVGNPGELDVCHSCDNPPCVNPAHLFLGTHRDNMLDMHGKGRAKYPHKGQTHCKHGHEFTPENTRVYAGNRRGCQACDRERWQRRSGRPQ